MRWQPKQGEGYFYITMFNGDNMILHGTLDGKSGNDLPRIEFGNCFKTKRKAELAAMQIKMKLLKGE